MPSPTAPTPADYLRAALPSLPGATLVPPLRRKASRAPDTRIVVPDVVVDREHLAAYSTVCGFRLTDFLPATYPHVLAFASQLRLMASPRFPFPAVGLVHVANRITQHRPVDAAEPLTLTVSARDLRPHPSGRVVDLVSEARVQGKLVWEDVSTYLRRGPGADSSAPRPGPWSDQPRRGPVTWRLPADLGRRYAAASGDRNPIHLNTLAAKAFGFRRTIVHGMWTAAHALAAVQPSLPDAFVYDVAFAAPILLPSTVQLGVRAVHGEGTELASTELAVTSSDGSKTHLIARITARPSR